MSEPQYRVLIADSMSEEGLRPLLEDDRFEVVLAGPWKKEDPERFQTEMAAANALIVRSATTVTRELLAGAPHLSVIGRAGVGVDNIDVAAATDRGIAVLNAPAGNTVSAAELTMALILSAARRIPGADRSTRAGEWARSRFAGIELRGKILGLVGAGRIGGEVAKRARSFGMKVVAHDPYLTDDRASDLGVERAELDELIEVADILTLHVPLTEKTEGLIGAEELARMKPGAFLVNVARGGVVDETALAEALREGHLGGAALDVFVDEPLPSDSALFDVPNLILTPHLGASTAEAQHLVAREISAGVRSALSDGDLSKALNAPAIGGESLQRMKPLFGLATRLGALAASLSEGGIEGVEVRYAGARADAVRPLCSHVLVGLLGSFLGRDDVNFVNAPLRAESRGIGVARHRLARRTDYAEFLEVLVRSASGTTRVAGALLEDRHPRIVRIGDYRIHVEPHPQLVVFTNRDVPGVIGAVGTLLGSLGLNIAEYHQARSAQHGDALAALAVDGRVDESVVRALGELPEVMRAWVADLG